VRRQRGDIDVMGRIFRRGCALAAGLLMACAGPGHASGIDQLQAFLSGAKSGRAAFKQVVLTRGRPAPQEAAGTFAFQRPGRFRWVYDKPFEQLIVGDGAKLWIYDRDLNQVIVRKLDAALGTSPAALLAGDNALERNFTLLAAGERDGLEWVDARPKAPDSGIDSVRLGFRDNLPRAMELVDTFGNRTTLVFTAFERNVAFDAAQFRFVPPKGADVVGE
jgi:outer membrane lipoprotein carrier protein